MNIRHFSLNATTRRTRPQAPAWERTVLEAPASRNPQSAPARQAGACDSLGSQAGAWEPAVALINTKEFIFLP